MKYTGDPVLAPPRGQRDFRDPKVFWYDFLFSL
jgi:sucrose-6-phosphate hydrolase SacC (GH32 family)